MMSLQGPMSGLGVKSGKAPPEQMFSASPPIGDMKMDHLCEGNRLNSRRLGCRACRGGEKFKEINFVADRGFERDAGEGEQVVAPALAHGGCSAGITSCGTTRRRADGVYLLTLMKIGSGAYGVGPRSPVALRENLEPHPQPNEPPFSGGTFARIWAPTFAQASPPMPAYCAWCVFRVWVVGGGGHVISAGRAQS
jgi:hypothetical protein